MRMGVFGGTFDPVHQGHLVLAEQCREQAHLDEVRFIPAARPPHKPPPRTPFDRRVEMLELAVSGNPAFRVDRLENERTGPSFTVETLHLLAQKHPGSELFLLLGADSLHDLASWFQIERIFAQATLLVVGRPGFALPEPDALHSILKLPTTARPRLQAITSPLIEIASRDLRRRFAEGRSVRYLVPRAVEAYARDRQLYTTTADA